MDDLMLLISIIAVVAMISFIILGVVKKNKEHFKKVGISLVVAIVAFAGFIITYDEEESVEVEEAKKEEVVEKKEPEVEETEEESEEVMEEPELTTEERIEQLAINHFGQVDDFRYVEGVEEGTEYISVNAQISDNLTTNMTRKGFIMNARDFIESIKDENFGEVYIGGYTDMIDQYGNESNYEVISLSMLRETVDKINFDNISLENFENVADNIKVHPALQE